MRARSSPASRLTSAREPPFFSPRRCPSRCSRGALRRRLTQRWGGRRPDLYIDYTKALLRPDFAVSAQNCWTGKGGAFTGQITAEMIKDVGLGWVLIGHSECRHTIGKGEDSNEAGASDGIAAFDAFVRAAANGDTEHGGW